MARKSNAAQSLPDVPVSDREQFKKAIANWDDLSESVKVAMTDLTPMRKQFCFEYVLDFNPVKAYLRAGFAPSGKGGNPYTLMKDRRIMAAIECLLDLRIERFALDRDWIESQYVVLYHKCTARNENTTARQCLRDLAEHHGMFIKQVALIGTSELEKRLNAGRKRAFEGEFTEIEDVTNDLEPPPAMPNPSSVRPEPETDPIMARLQAARTPPRID